MNKVVIDLKNISDLTHMHSNDNSQSLTINEKQKTPYLCFLMLKKIKIISIT